MNKTALNAMTRHALDAVFDCRRSATPARAAEHGSQGRSAAATATKPARRPGSSRPFAALVLALAATWCAAPAAAAGLAYVPNEGDGNLSVIDIDRLDAPPRTLVPAAGGRYGGKLQGIALARDGRTLYLVDSASGEVMAVDPSDGRVLRKTTAGKGPEGAGVSHDGKLLAVCGEETNQVFLFDAESFKELARIKIKGQAPEHCEFSPDDKWLLASNEESSDIDVIDVAARKLSARFVTGKHPRGIVFSPDGRMVFIANEASNTLAVVEVGSWKMLHNIRTAERAAGADVSPDGKRVYVANGSGSISVVDTSSFTVIANIPVGRRSWNPAVSADGKRVLVANGRSDTVSVIDTESLAVIKTIPVGKLPWGVVIAK